MPLNYCLTARRVHRFFGTVVMVLAFLASGCGLSNPSSASATTGTSGTTGSGSTGSTSTGTTGTPGTTGSGSTGTSSVGPVITLSPAFAMIRAGATVIFHASAAGQPLLLGTWSVDGSPVTGAINQDGTYIAPSTVQGTASTVVRFTKNNNLATASISLLNPVPSILSTLPSKLTWAKTILIIRGSGFIADSSVTLNGLHVASTFVDSTHLSASITPPSSTTSSVSLQVINPAPGTASSDPLLIPVSGPPDFSVSPTEISGGDFSVTLTRPSGISSDMVIKVDGVTIRTSSTSPKSITASGYLAPWLTGSLNVVLSASSGDSNPIALPITPTAVSYDAAARLAAQTVFGPREDVIVHIQQVGMKAFINEQLATTPDTYPLTEQPRTHFLRLVGSGNAALRQRTAWAIQTFIPEQAFSWAMSALPWERLLEAHAFGSYRQILNDAATNPIVVSSLNLVPNNASSDPTVHPNENFARELMQLFSLGTVLLNEDGTPQLDSSGNPTPTYGQDTVVNLSRVFTGWEWPGSWEIVQDPVFTNGGVDYSAKDLMDNEFFHDRGAKVLFGKVLLPAGQTATQDRQQALDAIFMHPNLPPFISRILIQRLVKSQPSPAYVKRIVQIFKDNGSGVRGDLSAVIAAILLDKEARAGDVMNAADDGFVQDPLYAQISAMQLLGIKSYDDQPTYLAGLLNENWWGSPSPFGYFSPSYVIPGTRLNSPEFQLIDNVTLVQRSQLLWGIVTAAQLGFPLTPESTIYSHFTTVPTMVDALNHMLYHGQMPESLKVSILTYCASISDPKLQLESAVFLALNSDDYTVIK